MAKPAYLNNIILESCEEDISGCLAAQQYGADQIELCAQLSTGGLTPDIQMVECVLARINIPVKAMVRNRSGNFNYTQEDLLVMVEQAQQLKDIGIKHFVFGACNHKGELDLNAIEKIADVVFPNPLTIHKAIDVCKHPLKELARLKHLNQIKAVLTSGGKETAVQGADMLRKMIVEAGNDIQIIAAGKVRLSNLKLLHSEINAKGYHGRGIMLG